MKLKKISTSITLLIAITAAISIIVLYFVANRNLSSVLEDSAVDTLQTSINTKNQVIDEYMNNVESTLKAFSVSPELRAFVKDPKNAELKQAAQDYTSNFYKSLIAWEGVYLDTWESEVITHSNVPTVGLIMRKDEKLKQLQDQLSSCKNGILNLGILVSPASKQLVVSLYAPLYENDKIIGFVGGGTFATGLKTLLDASVIEGMENAEYSLINTNDGMYIFDSDESLLNTEVTDEAMKDIMAKAKAGNNDKKVEYKKDGDTYLSVYKTIADRGWVLVIRDKKSEILSKSTKSAYTLGAMCLVALLIIVIVSWVLIKMKTKPLDKAVESIKRLENLELKTDKSVAMYAKKKDEVGQISKAITQLTGTFGEIVSTLDTCSSSLAESSENMSKTSKKLFENIEDNSATTEELSAGIIETNSSIEAMTSEIENMTNMAGTIECSVKESNAKSETLIKSSDEMTKMANDTLDNNSKKIENTKQEINTAIENLKSLEKINEMAKQILDITSQTNLLSLNASIEAARAGEAGKGFAVVADEIGKLAESSSKTVTEIQTICEESNKSIESVSECFKEIIRFLEEDVSAQFNDFADISVKYSKAVSDIKGSINSIDKASTAFIESVDVISRQVEQVSSASRDNETGVNDMIEKNNETTTTADTIINVANENKDNAQEIRKIVERFSK